MDEGFLKYSSDYCRLQYTSAMLPTPALSGSGLRVAGLPASQPFITAPRKLKCKTKTGDNLSEASCKKSLCMTSYGGIIRIRL